MQEETEPMITKALLILKSWSPDVNPKYAMVDFDKKEISALENVFPGILVFLCDFHREKSLTRWTSKADHGVSIYADEVKCRLRRIAHAVNKEELRSAREAFYNWEKYTERLKNWLSKTWFPEIKRWCVFYRPTDLILTNTNNGTERLNKELKSNDLENYRKCKLSEMLKIIIQEFLPKLYDGYVEINVKYIEKHKKYETALPPLLKNRPRKIIDYLLDRMGKVESDGINSVEIVGENVFHVTSSDLSSTHRLKYRVDFGDKDRFCSCTCNEYLRNRMLCKHFFTVIDNSESNFYNISKLFLEHPYINLDSALYERKTNKTTIVSNTETKHGNHKEESPPKLLENDCPVEDVSTHMVFQLPLR